MRFLIRLAKDAKGATAIEYGLIAALIFLAMVAGVSNFARTTTAMWNNVSNAVTKN